MQKRTEAALPLPVRRALKKFGADIKLARLKRSFTVEMMAKRIGIHPETYGKLEQGHPGVALGTYAVALFVLGFGTPFRDLVDQRSDDTGLLLDAGRTAKRARPKKEPQPL